MGYALAAPAGVCPVPTIPIEPANADQHSSVRANHVKLNDGVATARGNARLTRNGQALEAPYVEYDRTTRDANAHGGLVYYKPGFFLTAKKGVVNISDHTGVFSQVKYVLPDAGARGHAATADSKSDKQYQLGDATYTSCPLDSPAWIISGTQVNLDQESGRGSAWNPVMHLYGLPIFYLPYLNFPIDDKRHTGFLAPMIGQSSSSGFTLTTPFYINLAPNYDMTLIPRYYGKRGFQLGAQARYKFSHQKGEIDGQYLPDDTQYGSDRNFVHYQHTGKFGQYVGFQADYNRASDTDYFDDLDEGPGGTSTSQLERGAQLTFATTGAQLDVLVQEFQTLNRSSDRNYFYGNSNPYKRLPRVQLDLMSPTAPLRIGLDASFSNFVSNDTNTVEGKRYDAKPKLIWSLDHGGWFARSQAAYEFTHYDLSNVSDSNRASQPTSIDRKIPSFKLNSGLRFSRQMSNGWVQTLKPQFQYLYSGYENQDAIPTFDSGVPDLHYQRLFANNRFTGIDRIGDANQVTLGATTRIYSPKSGRTLSRLSVGRITSFRDYKVEPANNDMTGYSDSGSDYVGSLTLNPTAEIRARGTLAYSADHSRIDRGRAEFLYANDAGYGLNLGYRYYQDYRGNKNNSDTLRQVALGTYVPVNQHLKVVARWNYSLEIDRNIETLVGVELSPSCCVAARLSWRRYVNNRRDNHDHEIMFQFIFKGFNKFGKTVDSFVTKDVFEGVSPGRDQQTYNTLKTR